MSIWSNTSIHAIGYNEVFIGNIYGATLRLFNNVVSIDPTGFGAQFTEASFPGYAAVNLNAGVSWNEYPFGQYAAATWDPWVWTQTADAALQTIYGFWVDGVIGSWQLAAYLSTPVPMQFLGDVVSLAGEMDVIFT